VRESAILLKELVTPSGRLRNAFIRVVNGVIREVREGRPKPPTPPLLNYSDFIGVPGFVDTHIHGIAGADVNSGDVSEVLRMSKELVKYGVTSFIPTSVTAPHEELLKICTAVREAISNWGSSAREGEPLGARVLGLHLEGPYINPVKCGAQNPKYVRRPNLEEFREYLRACGGYLRVVTLAPEVEGGLEFVALIASEGVVPSLGHSNAGYEITKQAIRNGLRRATHVFNAMRPIHHRDPGAVVALLEDPSVYVEVIADFIHLHPATVKFVIDHVGTWRAVMISDSIPATGLPDGTYELGGLKVVVRDGVARLVNGALAGSTLTLDKAFRNLLKLGYSLTEAVRMTSTNPARSVGEVVLGDVRPGCRADLAILNDELGVVATVVNGVETYSLGRS